MAKPPPQKIVDKFLTPSFYKAFRQIRLCQRYPRNFKKIVCVVLKIFDEELLTFTLYSCASAAVYFHISSVILKKSAHASKQFIGWFLHATLSTEIKVKTTDSQTLMICVFLSEFKLSINATFTNTSYHVAFTAAQYIFCKLISLVIN